MWFTNVEWRKPPWAHVRTHVGEGVACHFYARAAILWLTINKGKSMPVRPIFSKALSKTFLTAISLFKMREIWVWWKKWKYRRLKLVAYVWQLCTLTGFNMTLWFSFQIIEPYKVHLLNNFASIYFGQFGFMSKGLHFG